MKTGQTYAIPTLALEEYLGHGKEYATRLKGLLPGPMASFLVQSNNLGMSMATAFGFLYTDSKYVPVWKKNKESSMIEGGLREVPKRLFTKASACNVAFNLANTGFNPCGLPDQWNLFFSAVAGATLQEVVPELSYAKGICRQSLDDYFLSAGEEGGLIGGTTGLVGNGLVGGKNRNIIRAYSTYHELDPKEITLSTIEKTPYTVYLQRT
ncbi:MAG: hypothetical protein ACQESG_08225 [Nanobdellota archaeon]